MFHFFIVSVAVFSSHCGILSLFFCWLKRHGNTTSKTLAFVEAGCTKEQLSSRIRWTRRFWYNVCKIKRVSFLGPLNMFARWVSYVVQYHQVILKTKINSIPFKLKQMFAIYIEICLALLLPEGPRPQTNLTKLHVLPFFSFLTTPQQLSSLTACQWITCAAWWPELLPASPRWLQNQSEERNVPWTMKNKWLKELLTVLVTLLNVILNTYQDNSGSEPWCWCIC